MQATTLTRRKRMLWWYYKILEEENTEYMSRSRIYALTADKTGYSENTVRCVITKLQKCQDTVREVMNALDKPFDEVL